MSDKPLENDIETYLKQNNKTHCNLCDKPVVAVVSGQFVSFGMPNTVVLCVDHIPTHKHPKIMDYNDYEVAISRRGEDGLWSPFELLFEGRLRSPVLYTEGYRNAYGENYHPLYVKSDTAG